jgi:hypothetical protein
MIMSGVVVEGRARDMATLLVRKLEAALIERLRQRARAHGRSVEGESFPADADPDSWRIDDRGEPVDL